MQNRNTELEEQIRELTSQLTKANYQLKLEVSLRESQERYILAIEGSGDGLWDWNISTGEVYLSARWLEMLGYDEDELPGNVSTWEMLIHPEDQPRVMDILNAHLKNNSAYNRFSLPKFWGTGKRVSADGTKWDIYEQNLLAEYHIRYGGYGGIGYYHVSDTYIALFSHFIPCGVWEAVYILDGLLKNTSDIQPDTIHADTQGQSSPVFALAYLLGIKLMPRIRNWQELTLCRPDKQVRYDHIQ